MTRFAGKLGAITAAVLVTVLLIPCAHAQADRYPSKTITFIIPAPPGGPADITARALAEKLTARLGRQVVVVNRGGAGTKIGQQAGAHAAPDGYTITYGTQALSIAPHRSPMDFDPIKDILPVSNVVGYAVILVVRQEHPANSLKEFIASQECRVRR